MKRNLLNSKETNNMQKVKNFLSDKELMEYLCLIHYVSDGNDFKPMIDVVYTVDNFVNEYNLKEVGQKYIRVMTSSDKKSWQFIGDVIF